MKAESAGGEGLKNSPMGRAETAPPEGPGALWQGPEEGGHLVGGSASRLASTPGGSLVSVYIEGAVESPCLCPSSCPAELTMSQGARETWLSSRRPWGWHLHEGPGSFSVPCPVLSLPEICPQGMHLTQQDPLLNHLCLEMQSHARKSPALLTTLLP